MLIASVSTVKEAKEKLNAANVLLDNPEKISMLAYGAWHDKNGEIVFFYTPKKIEKLGNIWAKVIVDGKLDDVKPCHDGKIEFYL